MANLDTNFLARPDFFVSTGENGQTITLRLMPKVYHTGDETQSEPLQFYQNGLAPFSILEMSEIYGLMTAFSEVGGDGFFAFLGTNPATIDYLPLLDEMLGLSINNEDGVMLASVYSFCNFVSKNPIHIKSINLRCENEQMLPQQIVVLTPNIFTGQSDRQIIDVASRKTAYQYQNGIITIPDVDLIICRNSTIQFNASFNVPLDSSIQSNSDAILVNPVFMDIVIDKYLSLEKALMENLKLM